MVVVELGTFWMFWKFLLDLSPILFIIGMFLICIGVLFLGFNFMEWSIKKFFGCAKQ